MTAKPSLPEYKPTLQELLDAPEQIAQADLVEYLRTLDAFHDARVDLETLRSAITEKLLLQVPIQRGPLTASIEAGKLQVDWGRP